MATSNEYRCKHNHPDLPSTDEVIALCNDKGVRCNGFTYPLNGSPIAYIKYGCTVPVGEMNTQLYVYHEFEKMNTSGSGVKVPEIYHAFECDGWTYIVMEYVDAETVEDWLRGSSHEDRDWVYDQVAKAINQLLRVRVPDHYPPGPYRGGYIHHHIFPDHEAGIIYNSVGELQDHVNKAIRQGRTNEQADFRQDKMCLCYSDIMEGNFLITKARQIYVIDFEHAAFLPTSFMSFVLLGNAKPLAGKIKKKVSLPESANLEANLSALSRLSYLFLVTGKSRLGLPKIK